MKASRIRLLGSTLLAGAALIAAPTSAQEPAPPPAPDAVPATEDATQEGPQEGEVIVTATSVRRVALDTPLAVTSLGTDDLMRTSLVNQADILNQVPTIKADGGGGEVATNVFVRGLPSGGQYQFTPLMYDGIPVMSSFGLNSSAFDVYQRNDLGISRLEFVRGGVSNLFGPGSVAGLINYISRSGTDNFRGTAQFEYAERGRYKGDLAVSGPLGNNLYYALSGWYRTDAGPVDTNLDTKGFQIRGNLKYAFPDNSGSVTLYGQYIDDQAQFYLPVPLDGATRNRVAGNDGRKVYQVMSNAVTGLGFNTPDGPFVTRITDGVYTRGGQAALAFDKQFGDSGFGINGRAKYSEYTHRFGLFSDGDGLVNVPETQAAFLSNATRRGAIPELTTATLANSSFTYVGGGALAGNALLFANRFTDRERPMKDYTAELNLTWNGGSDAWQHGITLGGFYGNARASDVNVTTTYLADFNNRARLVNLTTNGGATVVSRGGLLNAGGGYVNNRHQVERYAAYFADQMKIGDRFNFDIGGRIEKLKGDISRERTSTTITDATTPGLTAELRNVIWGNDGYLTGKVDTSEWALAAGALYKLSDQVSLYANGSRGYFFPEVRAVGFAPLAPGTPANASASPATASYSGEIIKQVEGGIKVDTRWFDFTAAAFYTRLTNRRQVLFLNAPGGGFQEAVNLVATRSWGVEATIDLRLMEHLRFNGNLTLQNAKYTQFQALVNNVPTPNPAVIGKDLERQPDLLYNAGLYYDDGTIDLSFFTNYTGDNFTASTNTITLKGWNVFNLDGGVTLRVMGDRKVRLGINVFNLFDTDATTEGSPRQDVNQAATGAYFVGRPVLPRRISARMTFHF